jgi:DNA-binding IscR family transcriptional regulator
MKLSKKVQYALLFVLHLDCVTRARTSSAAAALGLSVNFLEQVARKLRIAGLVKSVRGPGGGYELVGNVTIAQVLAAMNVSAFMPIPDVNGLVLGESIERRALGGIVLKMKGALTQALGQELKGTLSSVPCLAHENDEAEMTQ